MKRAALLFVGSALVALAAGWYISRDLALDAHFNDEEFFKYGSIGSEPGGTLLHPIGGLLPPAPIFRVLPKVCANVVSRMGETSRPGMTWYEREFGLIYDPTRREAPGTPPGDPLPVGISKRRRLGGEMLGVNCALCHAGTVRTAPGAPAMVIPGMPPQQVDVQRLFRFLFDCVESSEFTADNVITQIGEAEGRRVGLLERVRYRVLVPRIRGRVTEMDAEIGIVTSERLVASGPGRLDTINPGKALELGWSLEAMWEGHRSDELIATADFPPSWNLDPRDKPGFRMHWDGNFGSLPEVLLSAALAVGAKPQTLDMDKFDLVGRYLRKLQPPRYPYEIDRALAREGAAVFATSCAACHTLPAADVDQPPDERRRVGRVTPNDELLADPFRLDAFSPRYASQLQVALNRNYAKSQFQFSAIRKTNGYANVPLDGIWARAPYLHNGSVPTLRDLLQPPQCRPPRFHRGSDVYDPMNVGFVSYVAAPTDDECVHRPDAHRPGLTFAEAPRDARLFEFDTSRPGNRNTGHAWGTDLTVEQKRRLLEFLKEQ